MATVKDFSKLSEIEGVSKFILVRNDGYVVSENFEDAVTLSSTIITAGKLCDSLPEDLNNGRYIHLCIERSNNENIIIFSLGRYYLAIIKHSDADGIVLTDIIIEFLKKLS